MLSRSRQNGTNHFFFANQRDVACEIQALRCIAGIHDERMPPLKYWEIIADNLSKAGWSWGCVSAIDSNGRTIWIADARGAVRRSADE